MNDIDPKIYLSEILGMYKYKVDNGFCTMEEINGTIRAIENNTDMLAGIKEMADYFDKPESHVRNTIARNIMPKPKRKVYYSFLHFLKIAPKSWLKAK